MKRLLLLIFGLIFLNGCNPGAPKNCAAETYSAIELFEVQTLEVLIPYFAASGDDLFTPSEESTIKPSQVSVHWTGMCLKGKAQGEGMALFFPEGQKPEFNRKKKPRVSYLLKIDGVFEKGSLPNKLFLYWQDHTYGSFKFLDGELNYYTVKDSAKNFRFGSEFGSFETISKSLSKTEYEKHQLAAEEGSLDFLFMKTYEGDSECHLGEHSVKQEEFIGRDPGYGYNILVDCFVKTEEYDRALVYLNRLSGKYDEARFLRKFGGLLTIIHYNLGDYDKALYYAEFAGKTGVKGNQVLSILQSPKFDEFPKIRDKLLYQHTLRSAEHAIILGGSQAALNDCQVGNSCNDLPFHPANELASKYCAANMCSRGLSVIESELRRDPAFLDNVRLPLLAEYGLIKGSLDLQDYENLHKSFVPPQSNKVNVPVVRIFNVEDRFMKSRSTLRNGSGVLVSPKHVLTNFHVVSRDYSTYLRGDYFDVGVLTEVIVYFPSDLSQIPVTGRDLRNLPVQYGKIIDFDRASDLALIELETEVAPLATPVSVAPKNDDIAYGLLTSKGFPAVRDPKGYLKLKPTSGEGRFVSYRKNHGVYATVDYKDNLEMKHSAIAAEGMSGGPITNSCNQLITVNTATEVTNNREMRNGTKGPRLSKIHDFLTKNSVNYMTASKGCLKFGSKRISDLVLRTAAIRYSKDDQTTGLILDDSVIYILPEKKDVTQRLSVAPDVNFDRETVKVGWVDKSTRLAMSNSINRDYDEKTRRDLARPLLTFLEENLHFKQALRFNDSPLVEGEKLIMISALDSGDLDSRKKGSFRERLVSIENIEVTDLSGDNIMFDGLTNSNSIGAPIFDSCGFVRGLVTKTTRNGGVFLSASKIVEIANKNYGEILIASKCEDVR